VIVGSLVNFVTALPQSRLMFFTHIAAVACTNNLLTELTHHSADGRKGGGEKYCQSYQVGGMARR